ncbi:hypothetical protein PIB30_057803 [Stylosanthes scabra]|uniref:Uncharacterized protein n=1 Tax=Stylosanthes scabra TaxID=79078 RepID=A0ABU6XJM6_9FABA|nr:hypothetical protein [Stylosanthes scabra]
MFLGLRNLKIPTRGAYKRSLRGNPCCTFQQPTTKFLFSYSHISFTRKEMSNPNLIVATLYLDGELKRDMDGIGFACLNPLLLYIQRVDMLDELKRIILRMMGTVGQKYVRRIAYRLLDILLLLEYKFKLFWLEGDDHVRTMFDR